MGIVEIRGLNKSYTLGGNRIPVLENINLTLEEGSFTALKGVSGSGKSTLLNIIGMLDNFDQGDYELKGVECSNLSETQKAYYRNQWIGFVFQSFNLIPSKTALENVMLPLYYQRISPKESMERASILLEDVGLADRMNHLPNELSGGQKQRVAIARALVTKPLLILADEPTGALDTKTSSEVMDLLCKINEGGTSILISTHDIEVSNQCQQIITISDGKLLEEEEILK